MMIYDRGSSFFWLLLSIYVCIESLRIGIGTLHNPGIGFFAFCMSGVLGILSLVLFLQTFFKKGKAKVEPLFSGTLWKRVLLVLIALLIYSKLMDLLGYLISTFSLMAFLFWILEPNRMRWFLWSLVISFLTTIISYYIFSILLNCQFPTGLFGL
jgi:hypothetical protein